MKMGQLFEKEPSQWGLRGDPYLWQELKETLQDVDVPFTVTAVQNLLASTYEALTGRSILDDEHFYMERFDHGGMSRGMINPNF
ncbi:hypothetical protein MNBD_CHLOROFLEXI01-3374 [hydrothermal vent metagenome]|uniref:Uncharacterized protein n=1 Tax=hydrothermal vent metagenome TaxID=652676 RepID=A0A3B0UZ41_9ZZZZ